MIAFNDFVDSLSETCLILQVELGAEQALVLLQKMRGRFGLAQDSRLELRMIWVTISKKLEVDVVSHEKKLLVPDRAEEVLY